MARREEISSGFTRIVQKLNELKALIDGLGGGSSKEYASFYLDTGGLTGQAGTERTIVINSTHVNSNPSVFSLATNQITVNKTGDYKIDADVYFNNSSTSRTEYTIWLELDGVEVEGSRAGIYQRGYDSGTTGSINLIIPITAGQVLEIRINRTDGGATAGYQDNDGTRLTIEEK